ncbi:1,4-beta-xylanase [Miniimonas arenae]|uniref:1,4-beta-xylanase n=1 Tax=Miniimonas arenae TaxID=676201 RepID=A0A5C5BGB5_9MICO|nr:glycoside hydrolase family 43 protein [Miniimonas arenae]TNU76453.1 1,4-beta-xylanase [Miniimonas arenae]
MTDLDPYGYVLVHFVEDHVGHGERLYLSLSVGDDPLRWRRLNGGEPVAESTRGARGIRDPHLVRRHDGEGFHVVATDLRVWTGQPTIDWDHLHRHGSRDLVVWDSPDLVTWSAPRYVTVAPAEAGMAWAPEAHYDEASGEYLVYWSSTLYAPDDVEHAGESYSRILVARTRDFATFGPAQVYLDQGEEVIDLTVYVESPTRDGEHTRVHRFAKDNGGDRGVFQETGSAFLADDFVATADGLGRELAVGVEAPLVFRHHHERRWYLWVDSYELDPQGYRALTTTDLASGQWDLVEGFELPANTKHGTVLPLMRAEWERLDRAL